MIDAVNADANIPNKKLLIGPNLATGWTPQQIWDTGFIDSYTNSLAYLAFERRVLLPSFRLSRLVEQHPDVLNLATGWAPQVWDIGFIDSDTISFAYLAFER
jgi:hypothetical protein